MDTKPRLDPKIKAHALRLLRDETGGKIKGTKLFPLTPFFVKLIATSAEAVALRRRSYIAQVVAQREGDVVEALRKAGLDVYCPMEPKSRRVNAVKRKVVQYPMLPGYVFPIFDENRDNWQIIRREQNGQGIKGLIRLFKVGERPVPVPEAAMQAIHDRQEQLRAGGLSRTLAPLPAKVEDWVQIIEHPSFAGLFGLVIETQPFKRRMKVEVEILGQKVPVELDADQVRLVS